jgi:hypothetical protein
LWLVFPLRRGRESRPAEPGCQSASLRKTELTLRLDRTGGTGDGQNIAVDDVRFAQVPEPSTLALLSMGCLAGVAARARWRCSRGTGLA